MGKKLKIWQNIKCNAARDDIGFYLTEPGDLKELLDKVGLTIKDITVLAVPDLVTYFDDCGKIIDPDPTFESRPVSIMARLMLVSNGCKLGLLQLSNK